MESEPRGTSPVPNVESLHGFYAMKIRNLSRPGFEPWTFGLAYLHANHDNLRCIRNYFELSETEAANVSVASELRAMSTTSNGFTNYEICVMLEAVCIE